MVSCLFSDILKDNTLQRGDCGQFAECLVLISGLNSNNTHAYVYEENHRPFNVRGGQKCEAGVLKLYVWVWYMEMEMGISTSKVAVGVGACARMW